MASTVLCWMTQNALFQSSDEAMDHLTSSNSNSNLSLEFDRVVDDLETIIDKELGNT